MFEKVNPSHPDKIADRISGAIVDLAHKKAKNPRTAIEVLLGHEECYITGESSVNFTSHEIFEIVWRICGKDVNVVSHIVPQDEHLAENQKERIRCGDNGIFKGVPITDEERRLSAIARALYEKFPTDGKYILAGNKLIVCQSNASEKEIKSFLDCLKEHGSMDGIEKIVINPLGEWTGGFCVDAGATNRKLGSDMAQSVTGGGINGKDKSKADVSINIYAWLKAQKENKIIELHCAIGDETVDGKPYSEIVKIAENYIAEIGGFEKFSEWGLI